MNYLGVQSRNRFEAKNGKYSSKEAPVSSYHVVNASASYAATDALKFSMGIENLFNSDYYPHIAQSNTSNDWYIKGKGRAVNLTLAYSF
ncbi:MAG: hypothetical protein V7784_23745 [Oceanospirillaceae bacterium]|jgi:iron complex outermembrane receptor protein